MPSMLRLFTSAAFASICAAPHALGQAVTPERAAAPEDDVQFSLSPAFEYEFEDEFTVLRFNANAGARLDIESNLALLFRLGYDLAAYDFDSTTNLGPDPWDDIHTLDAGVLVQFQPDNEWTVFGGPVVQVAREGGADWDDAIVGGGVVGASLRMSNDLTLGGGFGIVSQLQDDVRLFPVIIVDWELSNDLRLSNVSAGGAAGRTGVELIYDLGEGWELAGGVAYQFRRFRLDDDGVAPDGVGEYSGIPAWVRLSFRATENVNVSVHGGLVFGGNLKIEDDDGTEIGEEDSKLSGIVGVSAQIRF